MSQSISREVKMLAEIAEMKRIYSVIEQTLNVNPACVAVTSGARGEGKTTVAAGLAAVAALHANKHVLAVDLNWYSPALHKMFGVDLTFDFDIYKRDNSIKEMIQPTGIQNLDILTARSDQSRSRQEINKYLLGKEIVKQARENYDFTVIDTSSIFPTNRRMMDPVNIARIADGVAMVVLTNETPRQLIKRARMFLDTAGVNVLGVVVNQWQNPMV
ncbi:MAG: AAA family ATPase [Deltaproteobacteria bacterium]|nr:AAA family ATPase [Deltaproteobacteria bacterium]